METAIYIMTSHFYFRCSVGSVAGVVFLAFVVFIGYLRSKMPDGAPKPSTCATIKVSIMPAHAFGKMSAYC